MWGLFLEIFVAVSFAARDGWKAWQTSVEMAKIDPRKQPIVSMSAYAQFEIRPKTPIKNDGSLFRVVGATNVHLSFNNFHTNPMCHVWLELGKRGQSETNFPLRTLGTIGSICASAHESGDLLRFDVYSNPSTEVFNRDSITEEQANSVRIVGNFEMWQPPVEVVGGRIEFLFNGPLPKTFAIPPQTNMASVITSVAINSGFVPYRKYLFHPSQPK
jgi:hypothetical protein